MIENECRTILVVNDIEDTRRGIKELLERDGYLVLTVRDEPDAAEKQGCLKQIDLMMISLEGETKEVIAAAKRIRKLAKPNENLPVVIFCDEESREEESSIERDIYFSCPDDFNQLRKFIVRLLAHSQSAARV